MRETGLRIEIRSLSEAEGFNPQGAKATQLMTDLLFIGALVGGAGG